MDISAETLRSLYERLIMQRIYPGDVCPAEHVLVAYASGALPGTQGQRLEEHLAQCPPCREDLAALAKASAWFRQREAEILGGLALKGAWAGVLPWSRCPSVGLLYRYQARQIPETQSGKVVLAEMHQHLARCADCNRLLHQFERAVSGRSVSLGQVGASMGAAVLDTLRGFGEALVLTAQVMGAPGFPRGAPGFRGPAGEPPPVLLAPVLGSDGRLVVGEAAQARQCPFEVIQAGVKADGFLTVDLAATDRAYFRTPRGEYVAALRLCVGEVSLVFPDAAIDESGRVTFAGSIPVAQAVEVIPPAAMDLTVSLASAAQPPAAGT